MFRDAHGDDDEVDVWVGGDVGGIAVGFDGGSEVVVVDGLLGGFGGGVGDCCDVVGGGCEEVWEVGFRGPEAGSECCVADTKAQDAYADRGRG